MYCRKCLYSLEGLALSEEEPRGRCPECGRPFDLSRPKTYLRQAEREVDGVLRWMLIWSGAYAIAWTSIPYINYLSARLRLGRWPRDQMEGGSQALSNIYMFGLLPAMTFAVGGLLAALLVLWYRPRGWWWILPVATLSWTVAAFLFMSDPGYIQGWNAD